MEFVKEKNGLFEGRGIRDHARIIKNVDLFTRHALILLPFQAGSEDGAVIARVLSRSSRGSEVGEGVESLLAVLADFDDVTVGIA